MKTQKLKSERGQILVLLAVGFVVLLGFVALAVDGGMVLLDRRSSQNAADAAALAGAYKLARNPDDPKIHLTDSAYMHILETTITNAGSVIANANLYGTSDGNIVTVYYPPAANTIHFVSGDTEISHYIRVTITSTVNTSFLHFVFSGPVQNTVEAVAHVVPTAKETLFNGNALVALAPAGCGLIVNGSVTATVNGIFVNSKDNPAVCGASNAFLITTPSFKVVGWIESKVKTDKITDSKGDPIIIDTGVAQLDYPPGIAMPPVPTCGNDIATKQKNTIPVNGINYDEYTPGSMTWDNKKQNADIYFDPGIYCISGPVKIHGHLYNDPIYGKIINGVVNNGILLVITGTNPCDFTINGTADLQLSGFRLAPYAGFLFYFDPINFSIYPQGTLTFNGSSSIKDYINGTFYAPTCSLKVNGDSKNLFQGQVIGYDVTLSGGATFNIPYVPKDNFQPPGPAKVDLSQ
jgi:Flp pilus assembly protein TadG